ncbi:hypothetical protein KAR91_79625 [Candidatus Pacearchaeota archaeon]|nr:hypothetical protein [Candidatus Pacearchaeota archaeon]
MTNKIEAKNIVEAHLQSKLAEATTIIKEAQGVLLAYLLPDSEITAEAAISDLLQLLDNKAVVQLLNEVE